MRIQKISEKSDDKTRFAFSVFDKTISDYAHLFLFSSVRFVIGTENKTEKAEDRITLVLDYNCMPIQERDESLIRIAILKSMLKAMLGEGVPAFIENIVSDRIIIKEGLGDSLLLYYISMLQDNYNIANLDGFLEANALWISFYNTDKYNSDMLRGIIRKRIDADSRKKYEHTSRKIIPMLKKDITKPVIDKITREYKAVQCRL